MKDEFWERVFLAAGAVLMLGLAWCCARGHAAARRRRRRRRVGIWRIDRSGERRADDDYLGTSDVGVDS